MGFKDFELIDTPENSGPAGSLKNFSGPGTNFYGSSENT